jgi:hypothetical protein
LSKPEYFGEELEICQEFDLLPIMQLHCNYDEDLVI